MKRDGPPSQQLDSLATVKKAKKECVSEANKLQVCLVHHWKPLYTRYKKHFQNVMLVGMANEISKTTHTSVWIAQDTTESRVPRLNVHTNQILAHTFSHGTLDSVVS